MTSLFLGLIYMTPYRSSDSLHVDEFAFRLNDGNVKTRTLARLDSMIGLVGNRRITYKELIA